jgi:hypothetical protein
MRQLTYALWLKNNTDFSTHPGLINVITAAFNGDSHFRSRYSFIQYPSELTSDVQQLTELVTDCGLPINDQSFIALVQFGAVKTYTANINLPKYGDDSFVRFIAYGGELVAQQCDFSGTHFINLTIKVNSLRSVFLTGSSPILRNWDSLNPIPLPFTGDGRARSWTLSIPMIPGETLEYKFLNAHGQYEPGPNRHYTAGADDAQINIDLS